MSDESMADEPMSPADVSSVVADMFYECTNVPNVMAASTPHVMYPTSPPLIPLSTALTTNASSSPTPPPSAPSSRDDYVTNDNDMFVLLLLLD